MSTVALDPLIHHPGRLRVVATLTALPGGDALTVGRLLDMITLPPGSLTTCLRELDHAGYVLTGKTSGNRAQTTVALTRDGRAALDCYHAWRSIPGRRDLPDLTVLPARVNFPRGKRPRPGHKPGPLR
jgi:DNA-binding MarR family transcriptional regulator